MLASRATMITAASPPCQLLWVQWVVPLVVVVVQLRKHWCNDPESKSWISNMSDIIRTSVSPHTHTGQISPPTAVRDELGLNLKILTWIFYICRATMSRQVFCSVPQEAKCRVDLVWSASSTTTDQPVHIRHIRQKHSSLSQSGWFVSSGCRLWPS